jgi:hypothetical protein
MQLPYQPGCGMDFGIETSRHGLTDYGCCCRVLNSEYSIYGTSASHRPPGWIRRLCGSLAVEYTNATTTQFVDANTGSWASGLLLLIASAVIAGYAGSL